MAVHAPHFLLTAQCRRRKAAGDWRFVLHDLKGQQLLEVEDAEPAVAGDRLELLTVVRGLEALDQPSKVTLRTASSYVSRGLKYGLDDWRSNNWQWESHGKMVPMKNGDLWRRLDRALRYHQVQCQLERIEKSALDGGTAGQHYRVDAAHQTASDRHQTASLEPAVADDPLGVCSPAETATAAHCKRRRLGPAVRRWLRENVLTARLRLSQLGTGLLPRPWFD